MDALDDGTYDALVIDARVDDENAVMHLDLTITSGLHKGEMVQLAAPRTIARDDIALLGLPATLTVADGIPHLVVDR